MRDGFPVALAKATRRGVPVGRCVWCHWLRKAGRFLSGKHAPRSQCETPVGTGCEHVLTTTLIECNRSQWHQNYCNRETTPLLTKVASLVVTALVFSLSCGAGEIKADREPLLTVLFTTEIHGRLLPCDCPIQPLGGVARRATRIERYRRRGPVLVVDGGGWQAGGPYDIESDGDAQRDELRTGLMAQAMNRMSYDLICGKKDDPLGKSYSEASGDTVRVSSNGRAIDVPLRLWAQGQDGCIWAREQKGGDAGSVSRAPLIVLSRLEPDEATRMASNLPKEALVITALPLRSQRGTWPSGKATLVGFDFQSEFLGVAEIYLSSDSGRQFDIRVYVDALTNSIPDDPRVAAILEPHLPVLKRRSKRQLEVECWVKPGQLASEGALLDMAKLARKFGDRASIAVRFCMPDEITELRSLQTRPEWAEAGLHAVVQKYYPEKYWAWFTWRKEHPKAGWEEGAAKLGLLRARVRGALAVGEPASLLRADYRLMVQRGLEAAEKRQRCAVLRRHHQYDLPFMVIANRIYRGPVDYAHLARVLCSLLQDPRPSACKGVPACLTAADCRKRGFIGRCLQAGQPDARCDYSRAAVKVPGVVVFDEKCIYDNRQQIMEALVADLPGIKFRELAFSTPEARALVKKAGVSRLPAYFLGAEANREAGFADGLGKLVREVDDRLVLDGEAKVGAYRFVNRPRIKGRLDLFVNRSTDAGRLAARTAVQCLLADREMAPELRIRDILLHEVEGAKLSTSDGQAGLEEAIRAEVVRQLAPKKVFLYLKERARGKWEPAVRYAGLEPSTVRSHVKQSSREVLSVLEKDAALFKELNATGNVLFMVENCELIPINTPRDIRNVFQRVTR